MNLNDKQFEKLYIQLYNEVDKNGKCVYSTLQLKEKLGFTSLRIAERFEQKLRADKKIKLRKEIESSFIEPSKPLENIKYEPVNWNISKSKVDYKNQKSFKSYLVISDVHIPHQNVPACKALFQLMDDVKFDGFVIDGDYLDLGCISHWTKNKKLTTEGQRLKNDFIEGNRLLDEFDKRMTKNSDKRFLFGNHERFAEDFIEEFPTMQGFLDVSQELKLIERGYTVIGQQNGYTRLGKLYVVHGVYTGTDPIVKHLANFSSNVMFGHTHTVGQKYKPCIGKTMALAGYNIGCLCDMNPSYMKNKVHNWVHGFAIVHVFDNDYFDVELKQIIDGKFVYNGKVYDGN